MPQFSTPFAGNHSDKKLTKEELIRAIRFNIAAEYEAVQLYEQLAESIDDRAAKKILHEIADDEKVHAGNFMKLLFILDPLEKEFYKEGAEETADLLELKEEEK